MVQQNGGKRNDAVEPASVSVAEIEADLSRAIARSDWDEFRRLGEIRDRLLNTVDRPPEPT